MGYRVTDDGTGSAYDDLARATQGCWCMVGA